jgi:hypothetical protein
LKRHFRLVPDQPTVTATLVAMTTPLLDSVIQSLRTGVAGATAGADDYSNFLVHLQLLEFVQEHAKYLCLWSDERAAYDASALQRLLAPLFDALLAAPADASANRWHYKSQVAVTLTTLVVHLDVLRLDPPLALTLVHHLLALAVGSHALRADPVTGAAAMADDRVPLSPQRSPSRALREMTCRCLAQLERATAGLLAGCVNLLVEQLRAEPTHATQAYAELLSDVIYGIVVVAAHESAAAAATVGAAMPFDGNPIAHFLNAPTQFQFTSVALPSATDVLRSIDPQAPADSVVVVGALKLARVRLSSAGARALSQCVAALVDVVPMLERYGVAHVMYRLMAIVRLLADSSVVGADFFKHNFAHFLHTDTPYLTLSALHVYKWFPAAFEKTSVAERALVDRMLEITQLPLLASEQRYAALQWVGGLSCLRAFDTSAKADPLVLQPYSALLSAHACDEPREIEERVLLLAWCAPLASAADAAALVDQLQCIGDFRSSPSDSRRVRVWFDAVQCLLQRAQSKEAFDVVREAILNVAREDDAHRFVPNLMQLLADTDGAVADQLGLAFADLLESLPSTALSGFVGLAERVVSRPCVDAGRVLHALRRMLQQQSGASAADRASDWALGMSVLAVVRCVMLKRATGGAESGGVEPRVVYHAELLSDVLERLARHSGDVDVRDRAMLYHALLANLGATRIRALLEPPSSNARGQSAQAESEAGLSAMFHPVETDAHVPVAPFLQCQRTATTTLARGDEAAAVPLVRVQLEVRFLASAREPMVVLAGELLSRAEPSFCEPIEAIELEPLLHDSPTNRSARVVLTVAPLLPQPFAVQCECVFNDARGFVCTSSVQSTVRIEFRDLVRPAFDALCQRGAECAMREARGGRAAFDELWASIEQSIATPGAASGERGARVLRELSGERWRALCVSERLRAYVVDHDACDLIALHLAPSSHVLARATVRAADVLLDIRTDFWRSFEHIDAWLDEMLVKL